MTIRRLRRTDVPRPRRARTVAVSSNVLRLPHGPYAKVAELDDEIHRVAGLTYIEEDERTQTWRDIGCAPPGWDEDADWGPNPGEDQ